MQSTRVAKFVQAKRHSTMLFQTVHIIIALFAFLNIIPAAAKIDSFSAPTKILMPGHKFQVTFRTTGWIINTEQYYAIFGITIATSDSQGMGLVLGDGYGIAHNGHKISGLGAFNVTLEIPAEFEPPAPNTKYVLRTAVLGTVSTKSLFVIQLYSR